MFKLVSTTNPEEKWTLVVGKTYSVGRRNADITLEDDTSVSRNHASIEVDHPVANWRNPSLLPTLNITDTSKFGTFVCTGPNSGDMRQVNLRETECLVGGNRLRFGRLTSEFSVEYTPLVVTTSTLNLNDTNLVKDYVGKLGGHLVKDWHDSCDFVVMTSVTLTAKAVAGLLKGIHLVTPDYFRQYYLAAEIGTRINYLDPKNFEPPFVETAISYASVNLAPDPRRANLFGGKIFVFPTARQQKLIEPTVKAGGGKSMLLSNCSLDLLKSNDVAMFQVPPDVDQRRIADKMTAYKSRGKRLIAEEEISLAAIYVNVTKHCNPKANMTEHIFAAPFPATQTQPYGPPKKAPQILVPETQSPVNPPTPSMRSVVEESMNISAESLMSNDSPTSSSSKSIKMDTRIFENSRTGPVKRAKISPGAEEKEDADDEVPSAKRRFESNTVFPLTEEPIPKPSQAAASSNASKMKERNTQKQLSKLFMMSDSEDDDEEIPESGPQLETPVVAKAQAQSLRRSPRKKGRDETPDDDDDDLEVIPPTPEGSDAEYDDDPYPGLRLSPKKSPSKNKKRKLDRDDDISVLPTVKLCTVSTAQLPTLPIETSSARQSRRINTQGISSQVSQGKAKQSNLSQWLQGGVSQKRKPDGENEMVSDSQKKIKTELSDEDMPGKLEELKIKPEPDEELKGVTPAPVFTTSMIIKERTKEAKKPGTKGPNFKSFRKLYPFGPNNNNNARKIQSKPVNRTFIAVAANNITDEALERFEASQMLPRESSSANFESSESRRPPRRNENGRSRTNNRQGSDDHESIVVSVDVDVNAINTPSQNGQNSRGGYDPSDGLFDF